MNNDFKINLQIISDEDYDDVSKKLSRFFREQGWAFCFSEVDEGQMNFNLEKTKANAKEVQ
jgi:hypothetical protein